MPVALRPKIPDTATAIELPALIHIQTSALLWARVSVALAFLVAIVAGAFAYTGFMSWWVAIPTFLFPLAPIAAQNRLEELRRNIETQVSDGIARAHGP